MYSSKKGLVVLEIVTILAAMIAASSILVISTNTSAFAQQGDQKFTAKLTGKEEVPPKDTKASGTSEFNLSSDGNKMTYVVNVKDIDKVTQAHIHSGKKGENGPVVVWLFNTTKPTGPMSGMLSQGNFTSTDLVGPLKGKQMSDLVKLINDGQAYVNVHTEANPMGEIRGQLSK
jgi:CHRD domain